MSGAGKMAQCVKAPVANPNDLSSIPWKQHLPLCYGASACVFTPNVFMKALVHTICCVKVD